MNHLASFLGLAVGSAPDSWMTASIPNMGLHPIAQLQMTGGAIPMQVVVLLTALAVLPAILMAATPFLRIVIVLHFLRQALGAQTTPSNQVLVALALFLTSLVTWPILDQVYRESWQPYEAKQISATEAWQRGQQPVKKFLLRFAREKDIALMLDISKAPPPKTPMDLDIRVVVPAYVLSELRVGFQIGAVLFLPFLVVDLVVASVTLSLGMVQLPPVMVSAPLKILLFVLVDGWNLVVGSLMKTFS